MLKKIVSGVLLLCVILSFTVTAFASVNRSISNSDLYYENGNIRCKGSVFEDGSRIDLTMKLSRNGRVVRTWNASGVDVVQMNETYPAVSGSTYQLSFICYVDGNLTSVPSKTLVCPWRLWGL